MSAKTVTVTVQEMGQSDFYNEVMCPMDADGMTNSLDPDQTAPRSSLVWVFTVCLDICPNI